MNIDKRLFNEILEQLLPELTNQDTRQALIEQALFGSPVLKSIDWTGNADTFIPKLVQRLIDYGEITKDRPAIIVLLDEWKKKVGVDRQAKIERLIAQIMPSASNDKESITETPSSPKITGRETMEIYLPYLKSVPLTGRDDDVTKIQNLLGPHVTQVIAVGGTGKSRVAAEIALNSATGAIWHRCSDQSASYELVELIRTHYELDKNLPEKDVLAALPSNPPLIVIDNAEDVPAKSDRREAYETLLERLKTKNVPMLLTSRVPWEKLKPRKEHPLPALPIDPATQIALNFATAESVPLSEHEARELSEACRRHPRLIEFAVRQLHERSVTKVLKQLRELKHGDIQEALDEMIHKTVRQMVEQVPHGSEAERLLKRLVVFRGSFDEGALIALAPNDMDEETREDAIVTLQRWQFLRHEDERYRVEEVVTGLFLLDDDTHAKHFLYYEHLHGDYDTNLILERHQKIEEDWPNILIAIIWGWSNYYEKTANFTKGLNYYMRSHVSREGRSIILVDFFDIVIKQLQELRSSLTYSDKNENSKITFHFLPFLNWVSEIEIEDKNYEPAYFIYNLCVEIYRISNDKQGQARYLRKLGGIAIEEKSYQKAQSFFEEALSYAQALDDKVLQVQILNELATVATKREEYDVARQHYQNALLLSEKSDTAVTGLPILWNWGQLEKRMGNISLACRLCRRSLELLATTSITNDSFAQRLQQAFTAMGCSDLEDDAGA